MSAQGKMVPENTSEVIYVGERPHIHPRTPFGRVLWPVYVFADLLRILTLALPVGRHQQNRTLSFLTFLTFGLSAATFVFSRSVFSGDGVSFVTSPPYATVGLMLAQGRYRSCVFWLLAGAYSIAHS